ncbi:hypothetical protein OSTOST_21682 [Ostertagia ostertagi]
MGSLHITGSFHERRNCGICKGVIKFLCDVLEADCNTLRFAVKAAVSRVQRPQSRRRLRVLSVCQQGCIERFADHVIRGKLQLDSAIVDQAVTFRLKYLIALDGAQTLESIADWKVLLYLQKINASVDIVISLLSVEKILEMFHSCSMEETPDDALLSLKGCCCLD